MIISLIGCLSVNTATELSSLDPEIKQIVTNLFKNTKQMFKNMFEEGQKKLLNKRRATNQTFEPG